MVQVPNKEQKSEIERIVDLDRMGAGGAAVEIVASEGERLALTRRFGFLGLPAFSARVSVDRRSGGQVVVEGRLRGKIVQTCILTLDPVNQELDEAFRIVFKQDLAEDRDFVHAVYSNFPYVLGFVLLLTYVLLARALRSLVLALKAADVGIVASGTATLEAAMSRCPHLIFYRVNPVTASIVRRKYLLPYFGLPNILAGRFVVPEFMQAEASVPNLARAALNLYDDTITRRRRSVARRSKPRQRDSSHACN